jgi:peptidoglycan hydrolase-like protein with peptidoglycan-binding domain
MKSALWWTLSLIVLSAVLPVGIASAAAIPSRSSGASPSVTVHSGVSLSLTAAVVTPGEPATIVATVKPASAGRVVILRLRHHGRFVNLKIAHTNRLGVAVFQREFGSLGNVVLRATALGTADLPSITSKSIVESVEAQLPLVLAPNTSLAEGSHGAEVTLLQQRLNGLGYWVGTPDGAFGDGTQQAVFALEKVAGLPRSGIVNAGFAAALNAGVLPHPRSTSGDAIDVDLEDDVVMFVKNGALEYVINTSTGGGYTYTEDGVTDTAITPRGVFSIARAVNGLVTDSLGSLWRPRFFYEGFAIHGDSYVPAEPVSHGCVRVSNEAIDWIWANNLAPIGIKVWVY